MSITNNGTILGGKALTDATKAGFTNPVVATFKDFQYEWHKTFDIPKAGVENGVEAVTYDNIRDACAIEHIADSLDFDSTKTVTTFGQVNAIDLVTNPEFGNTGAQYRCKMVFYVKVA